MSLYRENSIDLTGPGRKSKHFLMQFLISYTLRDLLRKKPAAIYLIPVPVFFCAGAGLEFAMIKWRPNNINFCKSDFVTSAFEY